MEQITHNIAIYIFLKADFSREGIIKLPHLQRWAKENPSEFVIMEDLTTFDAGFFANHRDVAFGSKSKQMQELIEEV